MDSKETTPVIKDFLETMIKNTRRYGKWNLVFDMCSIGGKVVKCKPTNEILTLLKDDHNVDESDTYEKVLKLKWNGTIYVARDYVRATKTVNYTAVVKRENKQILMVIQYFLYVAKKKKVFFLGYELERSANYSVLPCFQYSQLMKISRESADVMVGKVEDIVEKCFYVDGNSDFLCVSKIPNVVEGD